MLIRADLTSANKEANFGLEFEKLSFKYFTKLSLYNTLVNSGWLEFIIYIILTNFSKVNFGPTPARRC